VVFVIVNKCFILVKRLNIDAFLGTCSEKLDGMKSKFKVNGRVKDSKLAKRLMEKLIEENQEVFDRLAKE